MNHSAHREASQLYMLHRQRNFLPSKPNKFNQVNVLAHDQSASAMDWLQATISSVKIYALGSRDQQPPITPLSVNYFPHRKCNYMSAAPSGTFSGAQLTHRFLQILFSYDEESFHFAY